MKKIIFILLMLIPINVFALSYGGCSYSDVSKMKETVKNINVSYDYYIDGNKAYFNVTLTNLTPDVYFYDAEHDKKYYYVDTNNGEITIKGHKESGSYHFYSNNPNCMGINAGTKYYKLPTYNPYYTDPLCRGYNDYKLCKKWEKVDYNYSEFKEMMLKKINKKAKKEVTNQYDETFVDKILSFYTKYYYFFLLGIIGICVTILYIKKYQSRI